MLRFNNLWIAFGWFLVLLVCYFSLTPTPPKIDIQFEYLDKLEHTLSYFILMFWFAQLYQTLNSRRFFVIFFVFLGIVLEVLQGLGGVRFFEYADMLANTTGAVFAYWLSKGDLKNMLLNFEEKFLINK